MKDRPLILCISDIHVGSTIGLLGSSTTTREGIEVKPNKFQKWLYSNWEACLKDFDAYRGKRSFVLVLVGDMVEGIHHGGRQTWSNDPIDHAAAAVMLLRPLAQKASKTFLAVGTECHTRNDEGAIGKELQAEICPDTGHHAWDTVSIDVEGQLVQFRHHMPTTSRVYLEAGAMSIVLGNTQLSYQRAKQRVPDIIVSGHRHREGVYYDSEAMFCVCPAWQGLTRHGHKVVPGALPRPGFLVLDWVRSDTLPYAGFIRQPSPPRMEAIATWPNQPTKN